MEKPLDVIIVDPAFGLNVVYYDKKGDTIKGVLVLRWHQIAVWAIHGIQFVAQLLPRNDGDPGREWLVVREDYASDVHQFETRTEDLAKAIRLVEEFLEE